MQSLMSMVDPETERATYNRGISESSDPGGLSSSRTSCELGPGGGGGGGWVHKRITKQMSLRAVHCRRLFQEQL